MDRHIRNLRIKLRKHSTARYIVTIPGRATVSCQSRRLDSASSAALKANPTDGARSKKLSGLMTKVHDGSS